MEVRTILGLDHMHNLYEDNVSEIAKRSNRLYVFGDGSLAIYDYSEIRKPTGRVITAYDAYKVFGIDILEEALEKGSAIIKGHPFEFLIYH